MTTWPNPPWDGSRHPPGRLPHLLQLLLVLLVLLVLLLLLVLVVESMASLSASLQRCSSESPVRTEQSAVARVSCRRCCHCRVSLDWNIGVGQCRRFIPSTRASHSHRSYPQAQLEHFVSKLSRC